MPFLEIKKVVGGGGFNCEPLDEGVSTSGPINGVTRKIIVENDQLVIDNVVDDDRRPVLFDIQRWEDRRVVVEIGARELAQLYIDSLYANNMSFDRRSYFESAVHDALDEHYKGAYEAYQESEPPFSLAERAAGFLLALLRS